MKFFIKFFKIYSFIILMCSCQKSDEVCDANIPSYLTKSVENSTCYYSSNMSKILNENKQNSSQASNEEKFFQTIENHLFFNEISAGNESCKNVCTDESINRIYESLIALKVNQNKELSKKFSDIFKKIFTSMKNILGKHDFDASVESWANLNDSKITFPSLQRQQYFPHATSALPTKQIAYKYAIGLSQDNFNNKNPLPDPALQLDYFLFNAKANDNIGLEKNLPLFKKEREYYYNALLRRFRGFRDSKTPSNKTLYYGISKFDISELKAKDKSVSWQNWSRDSCVLEPLGTTYGQTVAKFKMPFACGISGTTNLIIWSLIAFGTDLNEEEMRLFLLSIWSTLSVDTGHSLQEVLTATKLNAIYLRGIIENKNDNYEYFRKKISIKTLESIEKVTQSIRPLSDVTLQSSKLNNMTDINKRIYNIFNGDRYYSVISCDPFSINLTDKEKQSIKELEYYFNQYDDNNSGNAFFGRYYDSFFRYLHHKDFEITRISAQNEFKSFFKKNCKNN
ncbi:hypothetical protein [Silvanigrella aquatica]|uniref:Lipoprotein n=1 Tax=Silvanigrella aquatica TaxID=1915309 RepID=A0A1L4D0J4_9BACT|nr:hypothetical protein [Silvanigrella aquatica]APJ03710.1 hypothetical protein AXG55_07240 [Silvanigrella aquatica]